MKWWRKKKRVETELPSFLKSVLIKFNGWLIRAGHYLQVRTNGYSVRKKKMLLLLFILVFAAESTVVIFQNVARKNRSFISVARIRTIPLQQKENQNSVIDQKAFLKIQRFKNHIDSLSTTPKGRRVRDSLLYNRPHLMDSVNFLVNLYLQNSKLKQ